MTLEIKGLDVSLDECWNVRWIKSTVARQIVTRQTKITEPNLVPPPIASEAPTTAAGITLESTSEYPILMTDELRYQVSIARIHAPVLLSVRGSD